MSGSGERVRTRDAGREADLNMRFHRSISTTPRQRLQELECNFPSMYTIPSPWMIKGLRQG